MANFVYLTCAACNKRVREPFKPGVGPVAYVHHPRGRGNGRGCRLIIQTAKRGHNHKVIVLDPDTSFEAALAAWGDAA